MRTLQSQIETQGWGEVPFHVSHDDRAEYAQLANEVISLALEDEEISHALEYEIFPEQTGPSRTGVFGIGTPRNSDDDRVYIHAGFNTRKRVNESLPLRAQPKALRNFLSANDEILDVTEDSMRSAFRELGGVGLGEVVFPGGDNWRLQRNVHLRTVRYNNALNEPVGKEVFSGHADIGLATLHLYETHGGWFKGTPYLAELITGDNGPEHRAAIREMRENLAPMEVDENKAVFFLGANWQTFPQQYIPEQLQSLPACYHAGFRPDSAQESVSEHADRITAGNPDRVSVIVFAHPQAEFLRTGQYTPASKDMCRPEYTDEL